MMPPWIAHARTLIGTRETPGAGNTPRIMAWALAARAWLGAAYSNDATPWCGLFVAEVMRAAGFKPPRAFVGLRAKQWATWGQDVGIIATRPPLGTIAVFGRDGGGHVGFVTGVYQGGDLRILGGNQGDAVNERRFPRTRLIALRWPPGVGGAAPAPWADGPGVVSTRED